MAGVAGTVTITEQHIKSVAKITFTWTSGSIDFAGTASGTTTGAYDGEILGMTTIPDGVAAPDDNYDVTITDAGSHDVLLGAGANRATATTQHVVRANLAAVAESKLTINVTNAGTSKAGVFVLYIR